MKKLAFLTSFCLLFFFLFAFLGLDSGKAGWFSAAADHLDPVRPLPVFSLQDGWLGADDAYSISLGGDKSLWLFGDTFVANRDTRLRSQYKAMVRNTVGISRCPAGGPCTLTYFWQKPYSDKPRSFFDTDSGTDQIWYWPLDAVLHKKTLYVSLLTVRNKANAGANDAFGFEIAGTRLVTVSNPLDSPDKWKMSMQDLSDGRFWPGVVMIEDGQYVLWYTQVTGGEGKGFMTVLRTPKQNLAAPSSAWEYRKQDGSWGRGLPGEDAAHIIEQAVSEMTVRYHPTIHKWVAILPGPGFPTPEVDLRTADSPLGPWSPPQKLFEFPEMKADRAGYDKDTFCYATKEHIEFTDARIALTYACNSMVLAKTVANPDIYIPRVVILDLPHSVRRPE